MNVDQYQILSARTASPTQTREQQEDMAMMGMVGELGEYAELFKKKIFHDKELTGDRAREEAGDFLWYLALAATNKGTRFSEWTGVPDFAIFDQAAKESLDRGQEKNPEVDRVALSRSPTFFYQLAKSVVGGISVAQALTILAVTLEPFGGLAWAARDNVRKLEARWNLPTGDVEGVPAPVIAINPPEPESKPSFDAEDRIVNGAPVEATTTPGGNE